MLISGEAAPGTVGRSNFLPQEIAWVKIPDVGFVGLVG